jgi:hypothetical protein
VALEVDDSRNVQARGPGQGRLGQTQKSATGTTLRGRDPYILWTIVPIDGRDSLRHSPSLACRVACVPAVGCVSHGNENSKSSGFAALQCSDWHVRLRLRRSQKELHFMNSYDQLSVLDDLANELLVASTLLALMAVPSERTPTLRNMCGAAVERCQGHVARLIQSAGGSSDQQDVQMN